MNHTVQLELSPQLWNQTQTMVQQGWVSNLPSLINEALRRYLESHQDVFNEAFILEDLEWGLHGND